MTKEVIQGHAVEIPEGMAGIRMMLGMLQGQITNLQDKMDENQTKNETEHRKVHEIVDATSEAMRNLTAATTKMEPIVESYKMNEKEIREAVSLAMAYRDSVIEKRGINRMLGYVIAAVSVIGGAVGFVVSEVVKALMRKYGS